MATGKHGQFLEELISEFEAIGYTINQPIKILDASEYGRTSKAQKINLNW
jgi:DNA (cytosine-5)-methyltransferase 1